MNRSLLVSLDGSLLVDRLADDVKDASKSSGTHGDHDRGSGVADFLSSDKALGGLHGNSADSVLSEMLSDLQNQARSAGSDLDL